MDQDDTCRTCKRWGYHFEKGQRWRTCCNVGSPMSEKTEVLREGGAGVKTRADFGCKEHQPKGENPTS